MLIKMLRFDYESIKRELSLSIGLVAVAAICSICSREQETLLAVILTVALLMVLVGINRLLGSAMFGVEGAFCQQLPVDSKTRAAAKALLGGLWLGVLLTAAFMILFSSWAGGGVQEVNRGFMETAVLYLLSIGFPPVMAGISMALIPVCMVLISSIFCMGIMITQIEINFMVSKRFRGLGLLIITAIAVVLTGSLILGLVVLLKKLVFLHMAGLWLTAVLFAGLGIVVFLFLECCARMMDTKINLS